MVYEDLDHWTLADHELSEMNERIESKISKRLYKLSQGI